MSYGDETSRGTSTECAVSCWGGDTGTPLHLPSISQPAARLEREDGEQWELMGREEGGWMEGRMDGQGRAEGSSGQRRAWGRARRCSVWHVVVTAAVSVSVSVSVPSLPRFASHSGSGVVDVEFGTRLLIRQTREGIAWLATRISYDCRAPVVR
ncbi:hypothetical protein AXG93_2351s1110 [Marchantia polymorpha subsp. ruderalis]|uniref:Uncharacterized protein n=1 Tax=Marchantia polymorpha subsp. ruderalis TaxID=1480154 RepID=A0A176W5W5_MARPO|nr:hypothetical protein AXG93_2351s1110 [Marchantia polymorpha subsp. ruderalis]